MTSLVIAPLRMHWVQTRMDLLVPRTVTRTRCRFGLNCRRLMPVTLVRALVPANEVQVPAAGETDLLLRHLPLAPIQPPPSADGAPATPRTRLRIAPPTASQQ